MTATPSPLPADLFTDWTGVVALRLESAPAGAAPATTPAFEHLTETDTDAIGALERRIQSGAIKHLVADVRDLPIVNTAKLGLIMRLRREIAARGGEVVVIHNSDDIGGVLAITRLDRLLRIVQV